jgi:hypothetical protein
VVSKMSVLHGLTKQQIIEMMDDNDLERNEYTKITIRNTKKHGAYWCIGVDEFPEVEDYYKYDVEAFRAVFRGQGVHLNIYREITNRNGKLISKLTKYIL